MSAEASASGASLFAGLTSVDDSCFRVSSSGTLETSSITAFQIPKVRDAGHAVKNNTRHYAFSKVFAILPEHSRSRAIRNARRMPEFGIHSSFSCSCAEVPVVEDRARSSHSYH